MRVKGIVQDIKERDTRVGKTYSSCVDGVEYGSFKTRPEYGIGDYIEADFRQNAQGFNNLDMKTLVVTASEAAPMQKSAGAAKAFPGVDIKDASIRWQSARNAAIALFQVASDSGALDLGAKKDGKLEALKILVNAQTSEFFEDTEVLKATGGSNPLMLEAHDD